MSSKFDRQGAILRLVDDRKLATQAEVAEALRDHGFEAVQTTVSRDIAQLGLVKVRDEDGRLVYAHPGAGDLDRLSELTAALRRFALALVPTGNLLVVTTPPGHANALARVLDAATLGDVAGTVAGDDTIFIAAREGVTRRRPRRTAPTSPGGRDMSRTAVLAYSGGLDTSCAIAWLKEDYGFDQVVAVLVDVGQDADFEPAIARGYAAGASDVLLVDRKREFANDQVAKALLANALYEGRYPLVSALSRPVIAEAVAEVALELDAEAVVHGCTGKGNDQLRFELAFKAKYPGVHVIAPLRDKIWTRDEEIAFAEARGIPVEAKAEKPYSIDDNLFGRAIEAGILEDAWVAPPEDAFLLTSHPSTAPAPVDVVVGFEQGLPVSLDGDELELHELIATLNPLAGAYGVGRIDMIENRAIGIKSRELYEAPAAIALIEAHRALEDVVLTKAEAIAKRELEPKWAKVLYDGLWFSPVRSAYDAFFAATQTLVTGEVRLSLQPGAAVVTGRRSEYALYAETLASYGTGETFPHEASEGFIRIAALEVELAAARERRLTPA